MSDTVRVKVHAEQTVSYHEVVVMSKSKWKKLKKTPEKKMESSDSSPLNDFLCLDDPSGCDDYSYINIQVVGDDGLCVEPEDYYRGGE